MLSLLAAEKAEGEFVRSLLYDTMGLVAQHVNGTLQVLERILCVTARGGTGTAVRSEGEFWVWRFSCVLIFRRSTSWGYSLHLPFSVGCEWGGLWGEGYECSYNTQAP